MVSNYQLRTYFFLLQTYNEYTTGLLQFCYNFVTL